MRRFLKAICIFLSLAFAFTAVTFCWFSQDELVNLRDDFGSAKASYFKSGNGSKSNKYVIASATHFYNFAWLQYLGYFNHGKNGHNGRYQSYFEVDSSLTEIDLGNLNSALPPIGTAEYPFIGNFEGNGVLIKNYTVSNEESALTKRPSAANFKGGVLALRGDGTQEVSTVGLFGITGDKDGVVSDVYGIYSETNQTGIFKDTANSQTAVPDAGVDKNEAYYSAMSVSNFYADELNVNSVSANTLVGLAAGYANAAIENVGVYRCGITVNANADGLQEGEAISKYSLLGDFNSDVVSWGEIASSGGTSGDDNAWGGSIDMRTLNRRLSYMYANGNFTTSGYYSKSDAYKTYLSNSKNRGKANYDWQGNEDINMHVMDGTIIPVNVNTTAMGIDSFDNVSESIAQETNGVQFKSNQAYKTNRNSGEAVSKSNTGYFVGAGADISNSKIRAGIRGWNSGAYYGVYKSFKERNTTLNEADSAITYTTSGNDATNKIFAFFTLQGSGSEWMTYRIVDDVNKSSYKAGETYDGCENKKVADLNFTEYKIVRKNFDAAMNGSETLHGFHFMKYLPEGSISDSESLSNYVTQSNVSILDEEMTNYQLVKGALNFTVEKQGKIAVVLGAGYNNTGGHALFDLYQVTRNQSTHSVTGLTRIEAIYTKKNGEQTEIAYKTANSLPGDDYSLAIDIKSLSSTANNLKLSAAYYFEMPVTAGDYAIGVASGSSTANAYLMYLDIGANGSDDGSGYNITTLDFVNSTANPLSTAYADVVAKISKSSASQSGASKIEFERADGTSTNSDGEINTVLYYVLTNFNEKDVIFTPESLSKKVTSFDPFQE